MKANIKIDYKRTKKAVEEMFNDYELMKFRYEEASLPKMTSQSMLVYSKPSGKPKSSVEKCVDKREELGEQIDLFIERLTDAFNRLSTIERQYMNYRFFNELRINDDEIMYKMRMSKWSFIPMKKLAISKFALAMGIEKYEGIK